MKGTGGDAREAFIDKMHGILSRNFHRTVPVTTQRSAGLEPQCGLIIGATPDADMMQRLAKAVSKLPRAVWSPYDEDGIHCTFGAAEARGSSPLTDAVKAGYEHLTTPDFIGLREELAFTAPAMLRPRLLVSADAIVLAGVPNPEAFELRELLLASKVRNNPFPVNPGWGFHITLARALRPLTDSEHHRTDDWLHKNRVTEEPIPLTHTLIGAFTADDNGFRFDPEHRSVVPINA